MGRPHRHGKQATRRAYASVVGAGSGVLALAFVLALHPWAGPTAGAQTHATRAEFQEAANRVCIRDYRSALAAAEAGRARNTTLVSLSISTLRRVDRDVNAEMHPAALDPGLARLRIATAGLVSYLEDNRESIVSQEWSPASQAAGAPLTAMREAFVGLGLRRCLAPLTRH